MRVYGRGPSARLLRDALRGVESRGVVNWTGSVQRGLINAATRTNKYKQLEHLKSTGLPVVPHSLVHIPGWLARSHNHQRGGDFAPGSTVEPGFWTMPMQSLSEWRVHVFRHRDKPLVHPGSYCARRIGYKTYTGSDREHVQLPVPIRSRQFGWTIKHFATPDNCGYPKMKLLARWAVAVLGWDFGAVDLLRLDDKSWMILEVNACPGVRDARTLETYVQALTELGKEYNDRCYSREEEV